MKTLQQHINEKLFISKNSKQEITWDSFIEALLKHPNGTFELDDNSKIVVNPPDDFAETVLGKLKGCRITKLLIFGHQHNKYIRVGIDSGFQSGLTMADMGDLKDLLGDEQLEQIYSMLL
jgi:hypothetical protein